MNAIEKHKRSLLVFLSLLLCILFVLLVLDTYFRFVTGTEDPFAYLVTETGEYNPLKDPYLDRDIDDNPIITGSPRENIGRRVVVGEDGTAREVVATPPRGSGSSSSNGGQSGGSSSGSGSNTSPDTNNSGGSTGGSAGGSTGGGSSSSGSSNNNPQSSNTSGGSTPSTPATVLSDDRGYQSRACGFDLDDDGKIGEPEDCRVCNGSVIDIDNDGVIEDQLYVDADGGSDSSGDGSAGNPYKTISHAWGKADGPGDGAEDIICFKGYAKEQNIRPMISGVAGVRTQTKAGSEAIDWEFPKNPTMLVGWDADKDGQYPPYDKDDVSVLDGSGDRQYRGLSYAFFIPPEGDYLEMAHFTAKDYGRYYFPEKLDPSVDEDVAQMSGFIQFGKSGNPLHHVYLHDLSLEDINRDRMAASHRIFFSFFKGATPLNHLAFINLHIANTSSFLVRGNGADLPGLGEGGRDEGPFRWQNLTVTARGARQDCGSTTCVPGSFTGWKLWGNLTGLEILDSVFDSKIRDWETPTDGGNRVLFVHPSQCSQDWTIRNNEIHDFQIGLNVTGGNGVFCDNVPPKSIARPVDDILFDQNVFINTYPIWKNVMAASLRGGDNPIRTTEDVTVTNNLFSSVSGFHSCLWNRVGNETGANPGKIIFSDNICNGYITSDALGAVLNGQGFAEPAYHNEHVVIERNLFTGLGSKSPNINLVYKPQIFIERQNIFDSDGIYKRKTSDGIFKYQSLSEWFAAIGAQDGSKECNITLDLETVSGIYGRTYPACVPAETPTTPTTPSTPTQPGTPTTPTPQTPAPTPNPAPNRDDVSYPGTLDSVAFFVESAHGLKVATCASSECYEKGENAELSLQYCDTSVFPHGCVRRWEDQSEYVPTVAYEPPEWTAGRDFGQDDHEKPGYVPNCLNGLPCVRGGIAIPPAQTQNRSFEIELGQQVSLPGEFSIFLLVRPVSQTEDFYYFGGGGNQGLRQNVKDNSLTFTFGGYLNDVKVAEAGQVQNNKWHLIEISRSSSGAIRAVINGVPTASGDKVNTTPISVRDVLSVFKGAKPMLGDLAALAVYTSDLGSTEEEKIRTYFKDTYKY